MGKDLDLTKPLFVFYIDVTGMSRQRAISEIKSVHDIWSYSNITTWIVPIKNNNTRVECVWDPTKDSSNISMLEAMKGNFESGNFDLKKMRTFIREWKLSKIVDEKEN